MPRDVSLSDSKCWKGGHEWVNTAYALIENISSGKLSSEIESGESPYKSKINITTHFRRHKENKLAKKNNILETNVVGKK